MYVVLEACSLGVSSSALPGSDASVWRVGSVSVLMPNILTLKVGLAQGPMPVLRVGLVLDVLSGLQQLGILEVTQ